MLFNTDPETIKHAIFVQFMDITQINSPIDQWRFNIGIKRNEW